MKVIRIIGMGISFLLGISTLIFAQEHIIITTYYPSPYGSYAELRANKMAVGSNYNDSTITIPDNSLIVQDKVGIGKTDPGVRLDVAQNSAIRVGNAYLSSGGAQYMHLASNAWYNGATWQIPDVARKSGLLQFVDNAIRFYQTQTAGGADWVNRMIIDSSGNVGIGVAAPLNKLHLRGGYLSVDWDGVNWMTLYQNTDGPAIIWNSEGAGQALRFGTWTAINGADWSEKVRITNYGNVGIGTTIPSHLLEVDSGDNGNYTAWLHGDLAGLWLGQYIGDPGTPYALVQATSGKDYGDLYINPWGGRVSIGTSTLPNTGNMLKVVGPIEIYQGPEVPNFYLIGNGRITLAGDGWDNSIITKVADRYVYPPVPPNPPCNPPEFCEHNIYIRTNNETGGHRVVIDQDNLWVGYDIYAGSRSGGLIDIAEYIQGQSAAIDKAEVVVIDPDKDDSVVKLSQPYATNVAGVISTKPHFRMGMDVLEKYGQEKVVLLAIAGRVPCKVSAENGPIKRGDILVTASKAGYAMKADLDKVKPGMIVGKALEPLEKGEGKILVLVD